MGRFFKHFGNSFGNFLGSLRPPKSEFKRGPIFTVFVYRCWNPLGAMLRQHGPPKLSEAICSSLYPFEKHNLFNDFLRGLWDSLGTTLGPFWVHFGKVLEAKIDANIDPDKNVKNTSSPRRESKNQCLNASRKHQKSMPKRLARHVAKKFPKLHQKSPKMVPRGSQEASKRRSKSDFNLKN